MKWSSILALSASVIFATACEKHSKDELETKPHGAHGEHGEKGKEAHGEAPKDAHGEAPKGGHGEDPKAGETKPADGHGETKPTEAPKYFPDSK
jgi:hypothetical protein